MKNVPVKFKDLLVEVNTYLTIPLYRNTQRLARVEIIGTDDQTQKKALNIEPEGRT